MEAPKHETRQPLLNSRNNSNFNFYIAHSSHQLQKRPTREKQMSTNNLHMVVGKSCYVICVFFLSCFCLFAHWAESDFCPGLSSLILVHCYKRLCPLARPGRASHTSILNHQVLTPPSRITTSFPGQITSTNIQESPVALKSKLKQHNRNVIWESAKHKPMTTQKGQVKSSIPRPSDFPRSVVSNFVGSAVE